MKIAYIVNARMPTEKAHGYQIAKMCEEFAFAGAAVDLYVPARDNPIREDLFSYYGIKPVFKVHPLKCFDFLRFARLLGPAAFRLEERAFISALKRNGIIRDAVVYSRDAGIVDSFARRGYAVIYDAHNFPSRRLGPFLRKISGAKGIVCNSGGTAKEFIDRGFLNVLVAHNAVSLEDFGSVADIQATRKAHGLPIDKKIAMYVGHLYAWKGVGTVFEAAQALKDRRDIAIACVGGTPDDVAKAKADLARRGIGNVLVLGHKKKEEIPALLSAADALLLPNAPISKESTSYTSPLKMFEYMASGVPIIASDLPSIREVLDENTAAFFEAGNGKALARAIEAVMDDAAAAAKRSAASREKARGFTWDKRASKIIGFIQQKIG